MKNSILLSTTVHSLILRKINWFERYFILAELICWITRHVYNQTQLNQMIEILSPCLRRQTMGQVHCRNANLQLLM